MEFRILGPLAVLDDAGRPITIKGHQAAHILARLLLHYDRPVSSTRLIQSLWSQPPQTARGVVHYFIHQLRKVLNAATDEELLTTTSSGYQLRVASEQIDAQRFGRLVADARAMRAADNLSQAAELLNQALGLWNGTALSDFAEEAFAQPHIARLEEQRLRALEDHFEIGLALGQHASLVGELDGLVRTYTHRERLHALRMLALYQSGRQAEALDAYQTARQALIASQGLEPGSELQRLQRAILSHDPSLDPPTGRTVRHAQATLPAFVVEASPTPSEPTVASPRQTRPVPPDPAPPTRRRDERKLVTALVVGLATDPVAERDPEEVRTQTAAVMDGMADRIRHYGGRVQASAMGQLLAVFGIERSREDDPERAVRAALELVSADRRDETGGATKAGVATGEVVVAHPPSGPAQVIGDVVQQAVTLEQTARPGTVLAGSVTYQATSRWVSYTPVQPTSLLEQASGMHLWQAVEPRGRTGAQVPGNAATPLVERERSLVLLSDILDRFLHYREPQFLTIVGNAGLGKSRLVAELSRQVDQAPELVHWRTGHARPHGQGVLAALAEIVRAEVGIVGGDDARAAQGKVHQALTRASLADDDEVAEALGMLLGSVEVEQLSSQQERLFAAWARFLGAVADKRPLVVVFEDLQWADEGLLEFVQQLPQRAETDSLPLLVVATGRPELLDRRGDWGGGLRNGVTITLRALTPEGTRRLLHAMLAQERLPEPLLEAVINASGGNPLYVEEYVHMLAGQSSHEKPTAETMKVPASVQQIIAAHIDTLPATDKHLLQDAAVIGEAGWIGQLAAVSGMGREEIVAGLQRLQRAEFLRRMRTSSVAGEIEYVFRHTLIRDVAYNQLLRAERADKHQRAAAWIEVADSAPGERVNLLAYHYATALGLARQAGAIPEGLTGRAQTMLCAAGDRASTLNATAEAARCYAAALELLPEDAQDRPELLFRLGLARVYGEHAGEKELLAAKAAFAAAGDQARVAEVDLFLGQVAGLRGDAAAMAAHLRRAQGVEHKPNLSSAEEALYTAIDLVLADRYQEALSRASEASTQATTLGQPGVAGAALGVAGQARLDGGDAGGAEQLRRAIAAMDAHGHRTVGLARFALVWALWWLGDLTKAQAALDKHQPAVEGTATASWMEVIRASVDCEAGRWEAAMGRLNHVLANHQRSILDYVSPFALLQRARIRLGRGNLEGALADVDEAMPLAASQTGSRQAQFALAMRGRALLAAGDNRAAADCLSQLLSDQRHDPTAARISPEQAELIVDLGQTADVVPEGMPPSRWNRAAVALASHDFAEAARGYDAIGATVIAASARIRLAAQLAATRPADARADFDHAVSVFESAGAGGFLSHAKALAASLP